MNSRTLQGQYAGLVTRGIAFFLDIAIVTACLLSVNWVVDAFADLFGIALQNCQLHPTSVIRWTCLLVRYGLIIFSVTFYPIYLLFFWVLAGQTLGKYVMGAKIVPNDGKRMNLRRAIRRLIGYFANLWTLGLGFLWIAIDDQRQGLHDIIAGTYVVYSWEARQNENLVSRFRRFVRREKAAQP